MVKTVSKIDLPVMLVRSFGIIRTQDKGIIPFKPFKWQNDYLEAVKMYPKVIIDKSREIGSSTIAVLNYTAETALNGGDFLIASYKKDSAQFLYETAKLFLDNLKKEIAKVGFPINYKVNTKTELIIENNGAHIKAMEMTPKVGRSFRFMRLLATEIAFWDNPRESWQALTGAGIANSRITVESTPNPDDVRGELFEELLVNPEFHKLEEDWRANPSHDEEWEKEKRAIMTDREFAQEYEHDHTRSASGNLVIPLKSFYDSINKEVSEGRREFGVDVARFGDDSSVVVMRNGGKTEFKVFKKNDTQELADEVANLAYQRYPERIKIDAVGVGAGVVDALKRKHLNCEIVEVNESMKAIDDKYVNARAEMYFQLREQIMKGNVSLPNDEELKEEVLHTHYKHNKNRIQIESKEQIKAKIKHSPDKLDALALAFYDRDEVIGWVA